MQNTITARRISFNMVALIVVLVAVAMLAGFVGGLAINGLASATAGSAAGQFHPNVNTAPALAPAQSQTGVQNLPSDKSGTDGCYIVLGHADIAEC